MSQSPQAPANMPAPPPGARDGQTFDGTSLLVRLANFVKLPHTVFGLPFALVGVCFASAIVTPTLAVVGWVLVAFTAARFAGMGFNRIVDRDVDALNPRTAMREIPRGALTVFQATAAVTAMCVLFVIAAWQLNPLCLWLSPVALFWVMGYSYTKRFTRWSHLWLGLGLGISPVGGYLAVTGAWSDPWWMLCALSLAVMTWTGGFDILYALQDAEFDRRQGLYSLPSAVGVPAAINIARVLHVATVGCLAAVVASDPLAVSASGGAPAALLWIGVAVAAGLLVWEHRLVRADDLGKLDAAFFTMNGIISMVFFACVLTATLLSRGASVVSP
jgi:4-hydroxybenzoate polyprenyltransferase